MNLLMPLVKIFMLFVAFSVALQVFAHLVAFLPTVAGIVGVASAVLGVMGAIKHHTTGKGAAHGFFEGVLWLPGLIWRAILAIVGFVFRFVAGLV